MLTRLDGKWLEPFRATVGLPPATSLRDLGPVVVLAGPNGSGKTRFFKALGQLLQQARLVRALANKGYTAARAEADWERGERPAEWTEASELPHRQQIAGLGLLEHYGKERRLNVCDLTQPENTLVKDAGATNAMDQVRCVSGCKEPGLTGAYEYQHVYLDAMARQLDLENRLDKGVHGENIERASRFNRILSLLLGTTVVPELTLACLPDAKVFSRTFDQSELSSGQKVLIAWAIALHAQADLRDSIVFIDEPENHLHPDACISALEALRKDVLGEGGQLWIATHSIQIIAWAGADALYSVEGGVVSYAGNKVKQVIDSLSGGEQQREHLRDFLASADHFGFFHFVGQCLTSPGVVDASDRDDQEKVFAQLVKSMCTPGETLRVLDYGAGKGRLADAIARESTNVPMLNYFLYDTDPTFAECRSEALRRLHELEATGAVLDELGSLRVKSSRVHLVVLCNVLHEIRSDAWLNLFASLKDVLLPEGRLVIIEDQEPGVGELPHEKGFLLLNKNELAQLFGDDAAHVEDKSPGKGVANGRISVLCIPREHLESATQETLSSALRSLHLRAINEVERLRKPGAAGQRDGRRHALYVLLAFNAYRALS